MGKQYKYSRYAAHPLPCLESTPDITLPSYLPIILLLVPYFFCHLLPNPF